MSEILETLESNGQLGKVLYELLEQVATSAVLKANEKDKMSSSMVRDQALPLCKSVPISSGDNTQYVKKAVADNENQNEKSQTTNNITVVDSSLGRPRYQWHESDSDAQAQRRAISRDLFSVFVGNLPTDITRGELEDLFSDIGEVVETHVCPPANGHSYTYGFVRFYTLEEAKDAVREKNLKVIGSRQINVELSSSTRRNLQMKPDDEDGRPLLQREYPKVQRPSNGDEKQVIEKLKASLRRLSSNTVSSLGDYNPDEVFENIKSILKMLINYPMALADPSTEMREDKSRSDSSMTKHQALTRGDPTHSQKDFCGEVVDQHITVPRCQISSRLPSFAVEATCNVNKLASSVIVEENNSVKSEHRKLNVTNKILEYLNSSSGEDNASPVTVKRSSKKIIPDSRHSWSTSSTDDELLGKSTIPGIKPTLKNYKKPHTRSKEHQLESSPLTADDVVNDKQIHDSASKIAPSKASHNTPEIITTHAPSNSDASIGSASCAGPLACPTIVKNGQPPRDTTCCSSDNGLLRQSAQESLSSNYTGHLMPEYRNQQYNKIFGQNSCSTDLTNGSVHCTSLPSLPLKISPNVTEQTCLFPDFADQELNGVMEDVQRRNNDKSQVDDLLSEKSGKRSQLRSSPCTENTLSQYTTLSSRAHPLSSTNKTLVQQPVLCISANGNFQQNQDFACTKEQNSQGVSEQQKNWSKQVCQTSFRVSQLNETAASNNGYNFSSQLHRALDMDEVDAQVSKDNSINHRNLLPDRSYLSLSSRNATEVVNDLPRKSRNEDYSSNYAVQAQENPSPPKKVTSLHSYSVPFENGKLRPQAQNTNSSHRVLQLLDSFSQESSDSAPFTNKKGLKSSGRRVLAPSFSFSSSTKGEGGKMLTNVMPAAECCVGNLPVDMTVKSKSKKIDSIMVNDSSIVGISKNAWKSTFDMSEVDLGIEDNDDSESAMSGPAFETAKSILDSSCPSNDVEIIQLKDMLDKNVRKLEELQQTCNTYPQRRRQRFAPNLLNGYARSSQLERQIHDAEVLLHKKEEMWSARSNERELAYEKELLHSTNSDPLLSQFAREMKKDSLCNLNNITDLKCKILQLKIEQYQLQESAQR